MQNIQNDFKKAFQQFYKRRNQLKVIFVATANKQSHPNSAPKMLVDIRKPNQLIFLDYRFTQTYDNLLKNRWISVSFMDDRAFMGFRLSGSCKILKPGKDFQIAKRKWKKRAISYEADRLVERVRGEALRRYSEAHLPTDFVIIRLLAGEASIVKPDRVLRAIRHAVQ